VALSAIFRRGDNVARKGINPERTREKLSALYRELAEASNPKEISRLQGKVARWEAKLKRMGARDERK